MSAINLFAVMFTSLQIVSIILVCIGFVAMIALNILLIYMFRKHRERKLCTRQLQQKREELLYKLAHMPTSTVETEENTEQVEEEIPAENVEEIKSDESEDDDVDDVDDDDSDDENEDIVISSEESVEENPSVREILAVKDMSYASRERLGLLGAEYDRKQYYVRYTLGFEAKLREADSTIQERYRVLADELALYKGLKIRTSFKQQRITKGNKTLGLIMFRGKTLCIAFALNPADYAETKYRGIDKSDKKRFAKTPMLFKISSDRKLEYAKYLLVQLADLNTIVMNEQPVKGEYDFSQKTRDELFVEKKLNIQILGEAPDLDIEELEEIIEEPVPEAEVIQPLQIEETEDVPPLQIEEIAEPEEELAQPDEIQELEEELNQPDEELAQESNEELEEEYEAIEEVEEEVEEEVTEEVVTIADGEEKIVRRIRYNRSFKARIIQSNDILKDWYTQLKNELLSYKGVKTNLSWKRESFRLGRKTFACFVVRGKTLCLCLATDPHRFDDTKYKVIDLSIRSPKSKQPCMYRIKNERRVKFAKQIIAMLMQESDISAIEEFAPENYYEPYRPTAELIEEGLIRIIAGQDAEAQPLQEEETSVEEQTPVEEVQPVEEAQHAEENLPVEGEAPVEEVQHVEEAQHAEENLPVEEEAPVEEVQPVEETQPVEEETPVEEELPEREFEILEEVDVSEVDVMSDEDAEQLVEDKVVKKQMPKIRKKGIVNIDSLSKHFEAGSHITIDSLREKELVVNGVNHLKILAKGTLNKPLIVEADDFSLQAVKMIVLTGGRVIRRKFKD